MTWKDIFENSDDWLAECLEEASTRGERLAIIRPFHGMAVTEEDLLSQISSAPASGILLLSKLRLIKDRLPLQEWFDFISMPVAPGPQSCTIIGIPYLPSLRYLLEGIPVDCIERVCRGQLSADTRMDFARIRPMLSAFSQLGPQLFATFATAERIHHFLCNSHFVRREDIALYISNMSDDQRKAMWLIGTEEGDERPVLCPGRLPTLILPYMLEDLSMEELTLVAGKNAMVARTNWTTMPEELSRLLRKMTPEAIKEYFFEIGRPPGAVGVTAAQRTLTFFFAEGLLQNIFKACLALSLDDRDAFARGFFVGEGVRDIMFMSVHGEGLRLLLSLLEKDRTPDQTLSTMQDFKEHSSLQWYHLRFLFFYPLTEEVVDKRGEMSRQDDVAFLRRALALFDHVDVWHHKASCNRFCKIQGVYLSVLGEDDPMYALEMKKFLLYQDRQLSLLGKNVHCPDAGMMAMDIYSRYQRLAPAVAAKFQDKSMLSRAEALSLEAVAAPILVQAHRQRKRNLPSSPLKMSLRPTKRQKTF